MWLHSGLMTTQIAIVLILLILALVLFSLERIPIEIVSLLLVIALVVTNTLTAAEAFAAVIRSAASAAERVG